MSNLWYMKPIADAIGFIRWKSESYSQMKGVVSVLMRSDPFRELDRLTQQLLGTTGTRTRPTMMLMDAWRDGDTFHVEFDLPGVDPSSIDLDVERNVVTVKAERPPLPENIERLAAERPRGHFSRQLVLGENVDTERISARYDAGVLALEIPVAETAKPRKIEIRSGDEQKSLTS